MTVKKTEKDGFEREQVTLKKEQAYIRQQLGVAEDESDSAVSGSEDNIPSCDELGEDPDKQSKPCSWRTTSVMSTDGGYVSSSDEDKSEETPNKCVNFVINLSENSIPLKNDLTVNFDESYIQHMIEGLNIGLPDDYKVPIDNKPPWLDMKKFKIGQKFAQDYYFGLNYAEMLSLLFLFSIPDGLQPLIYTEKSGTPFTAFRRYLSTVLRVKSWFEHDVWNEDSLGYRNLKTVRAMHLNVSKRINSVPYKELEQKVTIRGSSKDKAIWSPLKDTILEDFKKSCPFHEIQIPANNQRIKSVFFNQFSMSITQFGFVGLMVAYPNKFGATSASEEELDGFIHVWRVLGYLLGIEDRYNFCNGSLQEVRQRCTCVIEKVVKPQFLNATEDWEHMSRCLVEGISYYMPGLNFEVSLLYLCWVLDISIPRTYASLSWWHSFMFNFTKVTMCFILRLPGMRPLHNWLVRKTLIKASSWSPDILQKLESKTYNYEKEVNFNTKL